MTAGSASCAAAHAPASIFDAIRCVAEKSHARAEVRTRYSSGPCSLAQPISSRMADSIASPGSAASAERAGGPTIASPCSRYTARCRTKSRSPSRSRPSTTFRAERQPPVVMWSWNPVRRSAAPSAFRLRRASRHPSCRGQPGTCSRSPRLPPAPSCECEPYAVRHPVASSGRGRPQGPNSATGPQSLWMNSLITAHSDDRQCDLATVVS